MATDEYWTVAAETRAEITIKRSVFLACALHSPAREDAMAYVERLRKEFFDAVHHCFAYRLGQHGLDYRMSDDGEPSGTDMSIRVIPNFVDTNLYQRTRCTQLERQIRGNGEHILMHVSNFRPVKRVQDCIHILSEVRKSINATLLLVGDGPERSEAERLVRDLGLVDHVKFLGKQSALPEILSVADIFLLPSQQESFGLSALEAMSCSVPVVATNIGGIPEVVAHGDTGYIAELGDVQRMAKYCVELLSNPKKLNIFSENARKRAVEKFDISLIVPQYEALYEEALMSGVTELS